MSKTQIDRLGDRLRGAAMSDDDLRRLDEYRQEFAPAYEYVVAALRDRLNVQPTGRPAKSTTSIVDKLRRESIRLSQMQDIAGVRLIVSSIRRQDTIVQQIASMFDDHVVADRREHPSHGYRAVHIILTVRAVPVEIQVRTALQHTWAELSEKLSDLIDPSVKYGGGDENIRFVLTRSSASIASLELSERKLIEIEARVAGMKEPSPEVTAKLHEAWHVLEGKIASTQAVYETHLAAFRAIAESRK